MKGGLEYIQMNGDNFINGLMLAYPNLDWDESQFQILPRMFLLFFLIFSSFLLSFIFL